MEPSRLKNCDERISMLVPLKSKYGMGHSVKFSCIPVRSAVPFQWFNLREPYHQHTGFCVTQLQHRGVPFPRI